MICDLNTMKSLYGNMLLNIRTHIVQNWTSAKLQHINTKMLQYGLNTITIALTWCTKDSWFGNLFNLFAVYFINMFQFEMNISSLNIVFPNRYIIHQVKWTRVFKKRLSCLRPLCESSAILELHTWKNIYLPLWKHLLLGLRKYWRNSRAKIYSNNMH